MSGQRFFSCVLQNWTHYPVASGSSASRKLAASPSSVDAKSPSHERRSRAILRELSEAGSLTESRETLKSCLPGTAGAGSARLSRSPVVGDLPLTIHRDSSRPTDKPECIVRPLHRQQCKSPKSMSITRAAPQCHDFRCNQHKPQFGSSHIWCTFSSQPESTAACI